VGAAVAVVAVLLVLATAPLTVVGPAARLAPAVSGLSVESLMAAAKDNLWNQNGYGLASTAMIASHPWFGVGVGSFQPRGAVHHPVGGSRSS
jgi:O-antigen ligase